MGRLFCFFGWHSWVWTLRKVSDFQTEPVTAEIPDRAVCKYCGIKFNNII